MRESEGIFLWISLFLGRWRFVLGVALAAGILSLGMSLILPKWYRARAGVLPPREIDVMTALLGFQSRFELESMMPFSAGVTLLDVYHSILLSDRAAREIAEQFDLAEHYRQPNISKTLKRLRAATEIAPDEQGILEIVVEDRSPEMAANLANAYVDQLDRIFRQTRQSSGRRQREFLETRTRQTRTQLDSLDALLADVQRGVGLTALGRDATEASLAAAELLSRRMTLGVQMEMLAALEIGATPYRANLQAELNALDDEIARLPGEGLELARTLRDLYIQERLFEALSAQLEGARLEEARTTEVVEVLDHAQVPDRHSRPRRGMTTLAGFVVGFGLAFLWVVYGESRRRLASSA